MRRALVFLFILSGCISRSRQPPPSAPAHYAHDGFRIAAYNGEFLFDGTGNEGQADFPWKDDPLKAQEHLRRVGDVIRSLDADVVMLAEVENDAVLKALIDGPLAGMGYRAYFVQGTDTFTGQDVGLLSRVPISFVGRTDERVRVAGSEDTYGVSKNIYARLNFRGIPTTLIGLHFLAQPDNRDRKAHREAQAEVIRRLVVREQASGRAVAVLGDFNDFDTQPDISGHKSITRVLQTIKEAGTGASDDLVNVMLRVPRRQRYTDFYDRNDNGEVDAGEYSALDHILLSPALFQRVVEVSYFHPYDPTQVSDHFPIVVTLGLN
ncbi:MAG TPA: endonuclease/exonuclease/phosphatase family protein [Rhodothermales bacterium]|nr:endonuclease/exonuclease/phosphatase family protein [Rhodothermales bacterium]